MNFGEQQSLRLFMRALTHVYLEIPSSGQRFGAMHSFSAGEVLKKAGDICRGLAIILSGGSRPSNMTDRVAKPPSAKPRRQLRPR